MIIKYNKKMLILVSIVCILSVFFALFIGFDKNKPIYYKNLYLLPLAFAFSSIIFANIYNFVGKSLTITIIIFLYFIRLVIVPWMMMLGGYSSLVRNSSIYANMNESIILMIWEIFVVFLFLSLITNTKNIKFNREEISYIRETIATYRKSVIRGIIFVCTLYILAAIFVYPKLLSFITFFFSSNLEDGTTSLYNIQEIQMTVPKIIYISFIYILDYVKILLPLFLITRIFLMKKNSNISILISILIIAVFSSLTTSAKAESIFVAITLFVFLGILYPNKKKLLYFILGIGGTVLVSVGLILKVNIDISNENSFGRISEMVQAYFSGPANVATAISMDLGFSKLWTLISDIVSSSTLGIIQFYPTSIRQFNYTLYGRDEVVDQILPMIGQAEYFVGFIFSPVIICIVAFVAIKLEVYSLRQSNYILKYLVMYLAIKIAASIVLYNISTVIHGITVIVPMIMLSLIYFKKEKKYCRNKIESIQ